MSYETELVDEENVQQALGQYYSEFVELITAKEIEEDSETRVLMAHLEHLFKLFPEGFPRHFEVRDDQSNLVGKCWKDELSITRHKFQKAFQKIGISYRSTSEIDAIDGDMFQGMFYCRVQVAENNHRTFYYRNHDLINQTIALVVNMARECDFDMGLKS